RRSHFPGWTRATKLIGQWDRSYGSRNVSVRGPGILAAVRRRLTVARDPRTRTRAVSKFPRRSRSPPRVRVHKDREEKGKHYYRREIHYGAFQRSIPLPVEVDATKATAELKHGMLKITLPKSKQPKAREIKVAVA